MNTNELILLIVFLIISLFISTFLLSDMAVLIGDFGKADNAYQEKLDSMNSLLFSLKIDEDLQ
jgi:hypothetical protein